MAEQTEVTQGQEQATQEQPVVEDWSAVDFGQSNPASQRRQESYDRLGKEEDEDVATQEQVETEEEVISTEESQNVETEAGLFDDFKLEEEQEETPASIDYSQIAKELGFEDAQDLQALKGKIDTLKSNSLEIPDSSREYVDQLIRTGKAGASFDKITEGQTQIENLKAQVKSANDLLSIVDQIVASDDIDQFKNFLKTYQERSIGLPPKSLEAYMTGLDEMAPHEVVLEFNRAVMSVRQGTRNNLRNYESQITSKQSEIDTHIAAAEENKRVAQEAITKAIGEYEDPHVKAATEPTRKLATSAFNTPDVQITLPKGVAKLLLMNSEGKVDYNVILNSIGSITMADKKITHLQNAAKQKAFREIDPASTDTSRGADSKAIPASPDKGEQKEDWSQMRFPNQTRRRNPKGRRK